MPCQTLNFSYLFINEHKFVNSALIQANTELGCADERFALCCNHGWWPWRTILATKPPEKA